MENQIKHTIKRIDSLRKKVRNAYLNGKSLNYIYARGYTNELSLTLWNIRNDQPEYLKALHEYCDANGIDRTFDVSDLMC